MAVAMPDLQDVLVLSFRYPDPAELRLLIELSAIRRLADLGLSDEELAVGRQLARATMRAARAADASGFRQTDVAFHLYLLGLTGERDRCEVARDLLAHGVEEDRLTGSELRESMMARASEHGQILRLLADDMAGPAAELLRTHVARDSGMRDSGKRAGPVSDGRDETQADVGAFLQEQKDVPAMPQAALVIALGQLQVSEDPVVTFARLASACVPQFADVCQVELADGSEPLFHVRYPASPADETDHADEQADNSDQVLVTPFRAASLAGYPSYAGVISHWWRSRGPSGSDAVIADLMARYAVALVDRERLVIAKGRAEDRAASLGLQYISGRMVGLATGIVMHQQQLPPDEAEYVLRRAAMAAGTELSSAAASVVRCGLLRDAPEHRSQGAAVAVMRQTSGKPVGRRLAEGLGNNLGTRTRA
jgi:hypothetical protein